MVFVRVFVGVCDLVFVYWCSSVCWVFVFLVGD